MDELAGAALTGEKLTWGTVLRQLCLYRFGDAVEVHIISGTVAVGYRLTPDQAEDVGGKLLALAEKARS